ncbi:hypothetical protein G210_3648 [Candida maltosa Xu316]|uniref:Uncharacterized protein n=1 Tax=Candida maltosa (strain Xu316) TaxID=1245528 RepID=M3JUS6_CANMX|nr:hypothetical protein G210_3648 [Candida maltosa Xu316]
MGKESQLIKSSPSSSSGKFDLNQYLVYSNHPSSDDHSYITNELAFSYPSIYNNNNQSYTHVRERYPAIDVDHIVAPVGNIPKENDQGSYTTSIISQVRSNSISTAATSCKSQIENANNAGEKLQGVSCQELPTICWSSDQIHFLDPNLIVEQDQTRLEDGLTTDVQQNTSDLINHNYRLIAFASSPPPAQDVSRNVNLQSNADTLSYSGNQQSSPICVPTVQPTTTIQTPIAIVPNTEISSIPLLEYLKSEDQEKRQTTFDNNDHCHNYQYEEIPWVIDKSKQNQNNNNCTSQGSYVLENLPSSPIYTSENSKIGKKKISSGSKVKPIESLPPKPHQYFIKNSIELMTMPVTLKFTLKRQEFIEKIATYQEPLDLEYKEVKELIDQKYARLVDLILDPQFQLPKGQLTNYTIKKNHQIRGPSRPDSQGNLGPFRVHSNKRPSMVPPPSSSSSCSSSLGKKKFVHSPSSNNKDNNEIKNDRYYSRLNIYELSKILDLHQYSIQLTKMIESNVLEIFANHCEFQLGYQTWIRDTTKEERTNLIDQLYSYTYNIYPEIDRFKLEVIVRRGSYSLMQSRLRRERRIKQRSRDTN